MEIDEREQLLQEAGQYIAQAVELIREALSDTSQEGHAQAYIIPHLQTWIGEGNPYDTSVYDYIDNLRQEDLEDVE